MNEVICHGIPDDTVLEDGNIINVDVTAYTNGMHKNQQPNFFGGYAHPEVVRLLVERTRKRWRAGSWQSPRAVRSTSSAVR